VSVVVVYNHGLIKVIVVVVVANLAKYTFFLATVTVVLSSMSKTQSLLSDDFALLCNYCFSFPGHNAWLQLVVYLRRICNSLISFIDIFCEDIKLYYNTARYA